MNNKIKQVMTELMIITSELQASKSIKSIKDKNKIANLTLYIQVIDAALAYYQNKIKKLEDFINEWK